MIILKYDNGSEEQFQEGKYLEISKPVVEIYVCHGFQAVLYEKENLKGNSFVFTGENKTFTIESNKLKCAKSMRVLQTNMNDLKLRYNEMVGEVIDGWWNDDLMNKEERIGWWREAKFGCFIHWGVYSIAGGLWNQKVCNYSEHLQRGMKINLDIYKRELIDKFNPTEFDAKKIVNLVKYTGMKYLIITAKHHDGFAMYPSEAYPYDIRMTRCNCDLMLDLRNECKEQGIKFGFYYSHAFDWEHPDAPGNDWEYTNPGGDLKLFTGDKGNWYDEHPELIERTRCYVNEKAIPQIVELITKYNPDIMWFDTPHKLPIHENLRILKTIRSLNPKVVVNGRISEAYESLGVSCFADYKDTCDRAAEIYPYDGEWETIPTTNNSYGYSCVDKSHKPASHFIRLIVKSAARGGNVLMNIGPMGDGSIDKIDQDILNGIGDWFSKNSESIYGTKKTGLNVQSFGETTLKGNKLYLHVFDLPKSGELILAGLLNTIKKAYLLDDDNKNLLEHKRMNSYDTKIYLPKNVKQSVDTVVVVEFVGDICTHQGILLSQNEQQTLRVFDATHIDSGLLHGDGKAGKDYVYNFTNHQQTVSWRIRVNQPKDYKIIVRYTTCNATSKSSYSIYVCGEKQTRKITPSKEFQASVYDEFVFEIGKNNKCENKENEYDIIISPEILDGEFFYLYGIEVIPIMGSELTSKFVGYAGIEDYI